jgi:uncharacterized protein (DUF2336 family)
MQAQKSLIAELEDAVQSGNKERRLDKLRQVTDLFLATSSRLNSEQLEVFDDVLGHLVERVEARALAELSERLAPIENAPIGVIRSLASNDEIAVAGPVLMSSQRLTSADLVSIANSKSQAHLLAISGRRTLDMSVTDVLVQRGNNAVHRKLASSAGAEFSEYGYSRMLKHAETDETLCESLGLRLDIPIHFLKQLLEKASRVVRERLLANSPAEHFEDIKAILDNIGAKFRKELPAPPNFDQATALVKELNARGELSEITLLQFARAGQHAELIAALSLRSYAPADLLDNVFQSGRSEALLIPCKAAGLSWSSLKALITIAPGRDVPTEGEINKLKEDYIRLSSATAQRVLRFWAVQRAAGKDVTLSDAVSPN